MGEPGVRESAVLVLHDYDGTAKAVPLDEFLKQYNLGDLSNPTPLECLALKE